MEKREKQFLGLGMRPNSCRVQVGAEVGNGFDVLD